MIRRYLPNETNFNHNKYILHPLYSEVYEEANGMFELKMELEKKEAITSGDIISAPTPRGDQLFRVYRITKSLQGKKIYARHIFYDLANAFLIDTRPTNATVQDALQSIFTSIPLSGWTYLSDIVDRKTAYYIRKNPVEAIIGAENSILNHWGGNLVRNNKEVKILAEGIDRGFEIRLGKNLLGIEDDSDESAIVTRLYPTVVIDQVVHALPEQFVDSPLITNYPNIVTKEVRVNLSEEDLLLPIEDIYEIMREFCENLYAIDAVDKPQVNYTVDFVQLKKIARLNQEINYTYEGLQQLTYETIETLTYDQLQGTQVINQFVDLLEQLDLYDLVKIRVKELDIDLQARVVSYKYDCLSGNFKSIELGGFKQAAYYQTQNLIQKIANDLQVSKSEIAKIWDTAVNVVTGNKGGYKLERLNSNNQPYETLYMDTPDINTAQSILRINNAGIAGTDSGINGPYDVAITSDGWINAERLLVYTLSAISANLGTVTSGRLLSDDGTVDINLSSGSFKIGKNAEHTETYSKYTHTDGSYTQIGVNGLERVIAGVKKPYKYLTYGNTILETQTYSTNISINTILPLPSDFVGKNPNVFIFLESIKIIDETLPVGTYEEWRWYCYEQYLSIVYYPSDNTVQIMGRYKFNDALNPRSNPSGIEMIQIRASYIAIA